MERNDDHHPGGFKRNNSNNFGNRGSNNNGGPNSGYRNWEFVDGSFKWKINNEAKKLSRKKINKQISIKMNISYLHKTKLQAFEWKENNNSKRHIKTETNTNITCIFELK